MRLSESCGPNATGASINKLHSTQQFSNSNGIGLARSARANQISGQRNRPACVPTRSEQSPVRAGIVLLVLPQQLSAAGAALVVFGVALDQRLFVIPLERDVRLIYDRRVDQRPAVDAWLSCYHLSVRAR
jgi:hypothetical protein